MKWINRLYIFFLGIILSITTGFGLAAFYPQPNYPKSVTPLYNQTVPQSCYATPQSQASPECQKAFEKQKAEQLQQEAKQREYESKLATYQNTSAGYTRTAIFFGIAIGTLFAIVGIITIKKSKLVANGLLLGAVLTALLTRFLIGLASLGASTTGTNVPDTIAYIEFFVLLILSAGVIFVGLFNLKEPPVHTASASTPSNV